MSIRRKAKFVGYSATFLFFLVTPIEAISWPRMTGMIVCMVVIALANFVEGLEAQ